MTTDTAPLIEYAIPAERLAPLLHDRERVCEMRKRRTPSSPWRSCDLPAAWVGSARCPLGEGAIRVLMCEVCRKRVSDDVPVACGSCGVLVRITWIEAIQ